MSSPPKLDATVTIVHEGTWKDLRWDEEQDCGWLDYQRLTAQQYIRLFTQHRHV